MVGKEYNDGIEKKILFGRGKDLGQKKHFSQKIYKYSQKDEEDADGGLLLKEGKTQGRLISRSLNRFGVAVEQGSLFFELIGKKHRMKELEKRGTCRKSKGREDAEWSLG